MKTSRLLLHFALLSVVLAPFYPVGVSQAQTADQPRPQTSSVIYDDAMQGVDYLSCGGEIVPIINPQYEQEVVVLVNQERAKVGLPPLKRVDLLDQAARYHSADLGQDSYFNHDSYDRVDNELCFVCRWYARIESYYPSVRAENIAAGYSTPASVVAAWMDSTGHRQNILSAYSDEIGVGYYSGGGEYSSYWTQDFGNRGSVYPVVINGEEAETENRMVSLYVYGDWSEIRLRNNEDEWTGWQPFENTLQWQLPAFNGEHRVTVEMRKSDTSTSSSDTIYLSAQPMEPEIGNLPEAITFTYSIPNQQFLPEVVEQTPLNIGSPESLFWEISTQGTWFIVTPTVGTTPDVFNIIPTAMVTNTVITTTGVITISADSAAGIACTPHVMNVSLQLIGDPFNTVFIPFLTNDLP